MKWALVSAAFLSGVALTYATLTHVNQQPSSIEGTSEEKPLYWVAPMDPNYKRDQPGKSPMGMDLVPVYAEGSASPGEITISPDVVNNIGVRTANVQRKTLHNEIRTVGYVRYDENRLVHIHPRVEGWVETLFVKAAGDPVTENQPLYALYSPLLVNAQEEFLLAIRQGNERLAQASTERLRSLHISKEFIRQLRATKKVQQTVTFYSAQNGVVDNLNIREGFYVQPGTTIMSIGNLDKVWVEAEVFERQSSEVKAGLPVTMSLDYLPGKRWTGTVDYVYPTLDPQTRTARIRLSFDNPEAMLKPNMFAQVIIHTNTEDDRLVVPKEAVIRTGRQNRVVLALGEGRFKSIAVRLGRAHELYWEVLEGLQEGEEIVVSAQFLLDSESSKTSDFKRLHHGDDLPDSVWAAATINEVFQEQRRVNLTHEPVSDWHWPVMTMDLAVSESVEIANLVPGQTLHVQMTRLDDNEVSLSGIHIMDKAMEPVEDANTARTTGIIKDIQVATQRVTIDREAIEKWQRPAATVDFSWQVDNALSDYRVGQTIDFTFRVSDGEFSVIEIHKNAKHDGHGEHL